MYLRKFMKYSTKCRYLSALIGGAAVDKENALLADIKSSSAIYVFVLKDKQNIDATITDIFLKNDIDQKIASGTTKFVYSIKNNDKDIFKLKIYLS